MTCKNVCQECGENFVHYFDVRINGGKKAGKISRALIKNGEDTGLQDATPKKGSSRAVFFPRDPKPVKIDGQDTHVHTAVKIAFPGRLDRYTGENELLGDKQNRVESDHWINHNYGVLQHNDDGSYSTNDHTGILAPHFGHHEDYHHLETGKVENLTAKDFKEATRTPEFPSGISHQEFHDAVMQNWYDAHGRQYFYSRTKPERLEKLYNHPMVEATTDFVHNTETMPHDFHKANMGIWTHPITGKKHAVIRDYGYTKDIAKSYETARKNQFSRNRGY